MHSCPSGGQQPFCSKWTSGSGACQACQVMRSSFSCGSFSGTQPLVAAGNQPQLPAVSNDSTVGAPKINPILPAASLSSRTRPGNHPPAAAAAKVEAEAEHLREIEGLDYHMMEGIIRRRLHRDSENLDVSLEVAK